MLTVENKIFLFVIELAYSFCLLKLIEFITMTTKSVGAGVGTSGRNASIAPNDYNVPSVGKDGISSLNFSPTSNVLVSTSWDAGVRCWDIQTRNGQV
jgi:WD40 repeat protein